MCITKVRIKCVQHKIQIIKGGKNIINNYLARKFRDFFPLHFNEDVFPMWMTKLIVYMRKSNAFSPKFKLEGGKNIINNDLAPLFD